MSSWANVARNGNPENGWNEWQNNHTFFQFETPYPVFVDNLNDENCDFWDELE